MHAKMVLAFILFFGMSAFAENKVLIDVGQASIRKSLLAFPTLQRLGSNTSLADERIGNEIFEVISNDLDSTGLFQEMDPKGFLESPTAGLRPAGVAANGFDFEKWKTGGTEFLIKGGYQVLNGHISLEIYAYQVQQGNLVLGKKYDALSTAGRKIAHMFANDFVKAVTGKPAFFLNQIVFAQDDGPQTHREIYTSDWDGHNSHAITNHKTISIAPAWSPNGEYVAYTSFVKRRIGKGPMRRNPDMFIYEVKTARRWLVSYRDGLNTGAEFMPDNKHLLVTLTQGKTADIYKMTIDGKSITPLTQGPASAMNVEPAVSPDGKLIAFSSDRSDHPMIYTMDAGSGGTPKRRTFLGQYNSTPTWSPDSKKIAFASLDKAHDAFDIFIMNYDGTGQALRLTSAHKPNGRYANNEDPTFSPDGRQIMFVSDRTGNRQLYLVNTDGTNERRITHDEKWYSKPKWGPATE